MGEVFTECSDLSHGLDSNDIAVNNMIARAELAISRADAEIEATQDVLAATHATLATVALLAAHRRRNLEQNLPKAA